MQEEEVSAKQLAEEACKIEIDILGQPIGRQDQYAAAFGGVNSISFGTDGVVVNPLDLSDDILDRLESEFTLVFTGMSRRASTVLSESPEDEAVIDFQDARYSRTGRPGSSPP